MGAEELAQLDRAAEELRGLRTLWPDDVPHSIAPEEYAGTLTDRVERWARERPDTPAVHFYGADLSYAELRDASARFAGWLASQGVEPGDRVGVYLANCPQFIIAFLGILRLGAVHVPINPMFRAAELSYQLNDAGVRVLVADSALAPVVEQARPELKQPLTAVFTHCGELAPDTPVPAAPFGPPEGHSDWPAIMAAEPAPLRDVDPRALAALNYTGGTTGMPKGCEHTQEHMLYTAVSTSWARGVEPGRGGENILNFMPVFWIAGEDFGILLPLVDGSTSVLMTRWHPTAALELMESQKITLFAGMADSYQDMLDDPSIAGRDLSHLDTTMAVSFVRKLDRKLRRDWQRAAGTVLRESAYGMTESHTADTSAYGLQEDDMDLAAEPTYVGFPVPGTDIVTVDVDMRPVPVGEEGQILLRSPSVFTGYWGRPEATEQVFFGEWLITGDTGRFDERGALTYLARTKEMIKVNGMSVFPGEVESFFRERADVALVAVAPREDPTTGQKPVAYVQLAPGAQTSAEELTEWAQVTMASYKVPEIVFVDAMPMTATGKIRKGELTKGASAS